MRSRHWQREPRLNWSCRAKWITATPGACFVLGGRAPLALDLPALPGAALKARRVSRFVRPAPGAAEDALKFDGQD